MLLFYTVTCFIAAASATTGPYKILFDGNKIPTVALGTGRGTAPPGTPSTEVRDAVIWAIEAGYRHIDTASVYGIEPEVGQGIEDVIRRGIVKREDLFITTKLWCDKHRKGDVVPALSQSLKKLGLEYVDLYLIHFPVASQKNGIAEDIDYIETWAGMEEAQELGLTISIGVSNFNISQIDRLLELGTVPPAVNEVEVNPTMTQIPLVSHMQAKNITVMAYSPFGFLVTRKHKDPPPPRQDDPFLVGLAQKYNKTTGQIVLRYSIERGLIPIPKSTNKSRIAQNIDLFDFALTKDEVDRINAFNQDKRVIDGSWFNGFPYFPFVSVEKTIKVINKED